MEIYFTEDMKNHLTKLKCLELAIQDQITIGNRLTCQEIITRAKAYYEETKKQKMNGWF